MKIEIELEELEAIRKQNERLREEVSELNRSLAELDEIALIEKAKNLAKVLTEKSMRQIMTSLGFDVPNSGANVMRIEGPTEELWDSGRRWKVSVSAFVTKEFKRAFLDIGVIPPAHINKQEITLDSE